jgi:hypothetical protein
VGDGNLDTDIARSGIRRQDQRGAVVLLAAGMLADLIGQVRVRLRGYLILPLLNFFTKVRNQSSDLSANWLGIHSPDGSVRFTPSTSSRTRNLIQLLPSSNSTNLPGANSLQMRVTRAF